MELCLVYIGNNVIKKLRVAVYTGAHGLSFGKRVRDIFFDFRISGFRRRIQKLNIPFATLLCAAYSYVNTASVATAFAEDIDRNFFRFRFSPDLDVGSRQ